MVVLMMSAHRAKISYIRATEIEKVIISNCLDDENIDNLMPHIFMWNEIKNCTEIKIEIGKKKLKHTSTS